MKLCKKCGFTKSLEDFYPDEKTKIGRRSRCIKCIKKEGEEHRAQKKADGWKVYYLPEEHYVGIACNLTRRLNKHARDGRITDNYEIIAKFERAVDAHLLETMLHVRGYIGFNY